MRTSRTRSVRWLAAGAVACGTFIAAGTPVLAQNDASNDGTEVVAPAVAATSTVTLPLLGAPLIVDVGTDVGGGIVDVSLNQADDYTANKIKRNGVSFVSNDGTTKVRVSGHRGGQAVKASAATLAEVSGPGGWTGDVFGDGQSTTVDFTIGATAEGGPDITGIAVTSAATFEIGATEYDSGEWRGKDTQSARAKVRFEQNGERRTVGISVFVATSDDGSAANVVVGLSGVRGRALVEGDPVGTHTWSGALCDGTAASITYTVAADGTISDVVATPDAEVGDKGHKTWVAFSRREVVAISTSDRGWRDRDDDAETTELEVGTSERFRCERGDPTVNTEIDPEATDHDHEHRWDKGDGHDRGDRGDGRGNGWGGDRNDRGDRGDADRGGRGDGESRDGGRGGR